MKLKKVKTIGCIKEGDLLVIEDKKGEYLSSKVLMLIKSRRRGVEVYIGQSTYFNLGMYLEGKSWPKKIKIVV